MRPRFLEIEGLQSFKEAQQIDFDKLGETGLFGIFGPTGSGKSTILDAVTLALYGNVQRASRGTQGIMNTDMNTIKVSFTFDLLKGNNRRTYRVERAYKRKKNSDNYIESKMSRLLDVDEDTIIADKDREVTSKVIDLLGLDSDDFTRSVVLPQNKFQEFLFLDKAKKRDMMERIFYLEEYGRKLSDKVNKKLYTVRDRLSHLEGAISSLGDASEKALIQAEGQMKEAWAHKEKADSELKLAEIAFNKAREIWELIIQKNVFEEKEQKHLLAKDSTSRKKILYEKAVQADSIQDIIKKYKSVIVSLSETEKQLNVVNKMLPELEQELSHKQAEYDKTVEKSEKEIPIFIEQKARLNTALEIKHEIADVEQKLKELREKYQSCKKHKETAELEIIQKKKEEEGITKAVTACKKQIDALKIDADYRKKLHEGSRLEEALKAKKAGIEELNSKISHLKQQEVQQSRKYEAAEEQKRVCKSSMEVKREEFQKLKEQYFKNAAYRLAQGLEQGEACPVCGSQHHPRPARTDGAQQHDNMEELLKQAEVCLANAEDSCRKAEGDWIKISEQVKNLKKQIEQLSAELITKQKELDQLSDMLPEELKKLSIHGIRAELERVEKNDKQIEQLRSQIEYCEKSLEDIRQNTAQLTEQKQLWEIKYNEVEMEGRSLREQKMQKEAKLSELAGDRDIERELKEIDNNIRLIQQSKQRLSEKLKELKDNFQKASTKKSTLDTQRQIFKINAEEETERLNVSLQQKGFANIEEVEACILSKEQQEILNNEIEEYEKIRKQLHIQKVTVEEKLDGRSLSEEEWEQMNSVYTSKKQEKEQSISAYENAKSSYNNIKKNFDRWVELNREYQQINKKKEMLEQIQKLLKGNSFVEFISEERLRYIASEASETLGVLTKYRYALEVDTENGFIIRDNANGGVRRMITSLSGGEIFLTSLSLALSLSSQIQLKGQSPLEFFFLDEGFGTLDNNLLDTVIDSLERLSTTKRVIGLISHVPELKSRICRRLVVQPPTSCGQGSRVSIEKA